VLRGKKKLGEIVFLQETMLMAEIKTILPQRKIRRVVRRWDGY